MTNLDWAIVVGLMLLVFGFAGNRSLKTRTNVDWFLGGRTLPFWIVGVSMFATSVDGGEYIAMNGDGYRKVLLLDNRYRVERTSALVAEIRTLLGASSVM